jgi:hypothetical protein
MAEALIRALVENNELPAFASDSLPRPFGVSQPPPITAPSANA